MILEFLSCVYEAFRKRTLPARNPGVKRPFLKLAYLPTFKRQNPPPPSILGRDPSFGLYYCKETLHEYPTMSWPTLDCGPNTGLSFDDAYLNSLVTPLITPLLPRSSLPRLSHPRAAVGIYNDDGSVKGTRILHTHFPNHYFEPIRTSDNNPHEFCRSGLKDFSDI
jgi:hypothetical protein